jgi:N-acetylated-alpha-linked acidic dipeptidase
MKARVRIAALLAACAAGGMATAQAAPAPAPAGQALEARFDSLIDPAEMGRWLKQLSYEPNQVGSAHDKANAEWILAQLKAWGWDAHIEVFQVLYPTPLGETVELVGGPGAPFKATLQEPPIPGDASSLRAQATALPAYLVYQGDGDVTAPLVYVNFGMPADYDVLERMGVSVKGKIVIARYGGGWRGLKPKLAQDHGAVGCIIYSDPHEDGYSVDDPYPKGPARPPHGFQRGSVADMTLYPGDPLTPGVGATADAKRLTRAEAKSILKIPALPISYADAQVLLASLDGPVAPASWRGSLPITYHVGAGQGRLHLAVKTDWSLKPLYDVIGTLKGSEEPDEWIIRGNHHDGWVMGASDPLSGQVALLAEAKALGALEKGGWRPKRTIVYTSWDGEEPMLLGSTEWAETHAAELKQKGLVYINSDGNARGFFHAEGSHEFQHFINQVAGDVKDPETGASVEARARARLAVAAIDPGASAQAKTLGKVAADPAKDLLIGPLGSGSDYSAFLQHLGLAAIDVGYGGEGQAGGVYHSLYDDFEHHSRFVDPGFAYDATLAKTVGRMVLRLADADLPVQRYGDFAETVGHYLDEVKKLADTTRDEAAAQAKLLADGAYRLAADPRESSGVPAPYAQSPNLEFKPLDEAVARLKTSAGAFDAALARKGPALPSARRMELDALIQPLDQSLLRDQGLPSRPWYRNVVYAPGRFTGYGAKTLPGVREAIEERRFADAKAYIGLTAEALDAYAGRLDKATALIDGQ